MNLRIWQKLNLEEQAMLFGLFTWLYRLRKEKINNA